MTIHDTYRVVVTNFDGSQVALDPQTREGAMAKFDVLIEVGTEEPWAGKERLRVISEKTWRAGGPR